MKDTISIPKETTLSKEDWKDLYFTMLKFKGRVLKRKEKENERVKIIHGGK